MPTRSIDDTRSPPPSLDSEAEFPTGGMCLPGAALALTILALGACGGGGGGDTANPGDTGDTGAMTGDTATTLPDGTFAIVMNDGVGSGNVQLFTSDATTGGTVASRTLATGANQGIAFGPDGTLYQNGDAASFAGTRAFANVLSRPDMDGFGAGDRQVSALPGKGLTYVPGEDFDLPAGLLSCDVTDAAGALVLIDPLGQVEPTALALPGGESCWDTFYSRSGNRLYLALTSGSLAVIDDYLPGGGVEEGGVTFDRLIVPTDEAGIRVSSNLHGVYADGETVLLSDVGDVASASDGQLFTFVDDGEATGEVAMTRVGGPATLLGNPVDVILVDGDAIVAEKGNGAILLFEDVASLVGDTVPHAVQAFSNPESIEIVPDGSEAPAGGQLLAVQGPVSTAVTVDAERAVAVSFALRERATDVAIEFGAFVCLACDGFVALNRGFIGPMADFSDTIALTEFDSETEPGPIVVVDVLEADTYFVVLSVEEGDVILGGSGLDYEASENGAVRGLDFEALELAPFVTMSDFEVTFDYGLHFTVTTRD